MRAAITSVGSWPRSIVPSPTKLRRSSPAPISSTIARAAWTAASAASVRFERSNWTPLAQRFHEAAARPLARRRGAEHQPDEDGQPDGEPKHCAVDAHLVEPRDVARDQRRQYAEHRRCRSQPDHASAHAQHYTLGQELAHDPAGARAQCRAEGQLSPARDPRAQAAARPRCCRR